MKKLLLAVMLTIMSASAIGLQAQTKAELRKINDLRREAQMTALLESKEYRFKAVYALAKVGTNQSIGLTSDYYLLIKDNTLKSNLPFFGNSYSSMMGATESPLVFTSKHFTYDITTKQNKKNKRTIIKINAVSDGDSKKFGITIEVIGAGSATLSIESNNTSGMTFTGEIEPISQ